MKKLLLSLLVLSCFVYLVGQEDLSHQRDQLDDALLLEQLKLEKNELVVLEQEIAYFYHLLKQQAAIRELSDNGKISEIANKLSTQTKFFAKLFADKNLAEISTRLGELRIIYGAVPEVQDQLLYYQAELAYQRKELDKARNLLIDLTRNYPDSSRRNPGLSLLLEIYHIQGYDEELIDLAADYTGTGSLLQTYWLAQAYFNTEMYSEAREKFTELSNDENFLFRAKAMLALITYFTDDIQTALAEFQVLATKYETSTKYCDFVILSLARLSIINEEIDLGLQYYRQYYDRQKAEIPDDILYEIASEFKAADQYNEAVPFLNMIIEKPVKSAYYTSAKFLLAVTQPGYEDLDQTELTVEEMIAANDELLSTLNRKYKLLSDYHIIRRQLARTDTASHEYLNLKAQLDQVDAVLLDTNEMMEDFYKGLDANSLILLIALEEEYKAYCSTISEIEALVLLSKTISTDRISALLDDEIYYADSTVVSLQVIKYLGHRAYFSPQEYNLARHLAIEKILQEIDLQVWQEIGVIAEDNNHPDITARVEIYVGLGQDNLRAFEIIAELMFGGKPSDQFAELIQSEIDAVENNKFALLAIKQDVIANFNVQIAKKLNKEKEFLVVEFDVLKNKYDGTLNSVIRDIASVTDKYRINLLGILFQKTQEMDKKYKELQEKVRNE